MANSNLIEGVIYYKVAGWLAADNISAITYRFKKQARVVDRSTSSFLSQQQQEAMKTKAAKHNISVTDTLTIYLHVGT